MDKSKYSFKRFNYKSSYHTQDRTKFGDKDVTFATDSGTPNQEVISADADTIQQMAFRDLQIGGEIDVAADPNTQATRNAQPYAIIARTNRVLGGVYGGDPTIMGNVITRLANASDSGFLKYFDSGCTFKKFHYLYAAIKSSDKNKAYNVELAKTLSTALSMGTATLTLQLPFFNDWVKSTMPFSANNDGTKYSESLDARLPWMMYYQSAILNVAAIPSKYIQLRSIEKDIKDMTYRRDNADLNDLCGLLKKSSFVATMNSASSILLGEYVDDDWRKQVNTLVNLPSRKQNAYTSPLLTMIGYHEMPDLKIIANSGQTVVPTNDADAYFDSSKITYTIAATTASKLFNPYEIDSTKLITTSKVYTFNEAVKALLTIFDQTTLLAWARYNTTHPTTRIESAIVFNTASKLLTAVSSMAVNIFNGLSEIRSALDKMKDTGLMHWIKGVSFFVDSRIDPYIICYNKTLEDVISIDKTGSKYISFDELTYRWKFNTLWNMYEGIPLYDKFSGGAFLTFATKVINTGADVDYWSSKFIFPIFFENDNVGVTGNNSNDRFVNRLGHMVFVSSLDKTGEEMSDSVYLSRLNPFDAKAADGYTMKFAEVALDTTVAAQKADAAYVSTLLQTVYGIGAVGDTHTNPISYLYTVHMDDLCFLDIEISDVANRLIQYARDRSPFRVSRMTTDRTIGFGK